MPNTGKASVGSLSVLLPVSPSRRQKYCQHKLFLGWSGWFVVLPPAGSVVDHVSDVSR